jgi:thiol-disulfide isomerase/thioredoxin
VDTLINEGVHNKIAEHTRMANKKSTRKRKRENKISASNLSNILEPLDVRSSSALKDMEKRIRKGPVTLVLIYADWCGHCHELMPHWDKATESPNRSVQAVKVNETMLSTVNTMVNQSINRQAPPIDVSGYPTIIMVDNKGNQVRNVEPVKNTEVLTKAMNEVGTLAEQAGPNQIAPPRGPPPLEPASPSSSFPSLQKNISSTPPLKEMKEVEEEASLPVMPPVPGEEDAPRSGVSLYAENSALRAKDPLKGAVKGGSLYASMSQTAYTIAPAATLIGMASYMMREKRAHSGRKTRRGRKGQKKQKSQKKRR